MAAALFCKGWWVSGLENATRVHILCEDGSEVVVGALIVKLALKRRRLPDGAVMFCYRQIRCSAITISPNHRTGALDVVFPACGNHPKRMIMMSTQDALRLREQLVQRLDGWAGSNGAKTTNRTSVTNGVARV